MIDADLLAAYRNTVYRVRLAHGGWAGIHIDAPLPDCLQALIGTDAWCFVTAWNPLSQRQPYACNRQAQRRLLVDAKALSPRAIVAGVSGVGSRWREPGLLLVGTHRDAADLLAARYRQHGYVYGRASGIAQLRTW